MSAFQVAPTLSNPAAPIYDWGIRVIESFQELGIPPVDFSARFFTLLGEPALYLILFTFLFWCINERLAFRVGITLLISTGINLAIKETLAVQRPFYRKPGINLIEQSGYSTPSGHAQASAAFWPTLLHKRNSRPWRLIFAIALPVLIGLSRVYLGVHYPTDVLFGWILGAIISAAAVYLVPVLRKSLSRLVASRFTTQPALPVSIKIAAVALGVWILNTQTNGKTGIGGAIFGFAAGFLLLNNASDGSKRFSAAAGSLGKKALRLFVGYAGLAAIYFGCSALFSLIANEQKSLTQFIMFTIAGFWMSNIAPKVFIRIGLQ